MHTQALVHPRLLPYPQGAAAVERQASARRLMALAVVPSPPAANRKLPAKPKIKKKPPTTSSDRGRGYRERMKNLLEGLEDDVLELRQRVAELEARRSIVDTQTLQRRNHVNGSLARLVHKYFTLFQDSMAAMPPPTMAALVQHHDSHAAMQLEYQNQFQLRFLEQIMDPSVVAGDLIGPRAILDQWRRYAASHGSFRGVVVGMSTSGAEENPVVTLHARATGKITGATFYTLFPHAVHKESDLIKKFLHKEITYSITNRYLFSDDGRIINEMVDVGFVQGLLNAGATMGEVARLMESSTISQHSTLHSKTTTRLPRPSSASHRHHQSKAPASVARNPREVVEEGGDDIEEARTASKNEEKDASRSTTSDSKMRIEYLLAE